MMERVYVGIGSNIEPERHVRAGVAALEQAFGPLQCSTVYESRAVGFSGDNFYNLVVAFDTEQSLREVAAALRAIEDRYGRDRSGPRFSSRTLDIDLLLYGDRVEQSDGIRLPREEITENAHVLRPLAELAPERRHPVLQRTFAEMWEAFDQSGQPLWPVQIRF